MNNDIIHVDPHITNYTVYIMDNYTGNIIVKENVTKTQFSPNIQQDNDLCPMCQVSAWNAGGEGEMSEPVQYSMPQGKQAKDILQTFPPAVTVAIGTQDKNFLTVLLAFHQISFLLFCISISVPCNIIAESITVRGTVKPNVIHIHINNVSSRILYTSSCYTAWMLNLILLHSTGGCSVH